MSQTPRFPRTLGIFLCLVCPIGLRADPVETVQKSAGEWVRLRVETSRIDKAWQEERTLVESMLAALNERAQTAEEKRDLVTAQTASNREELETLRHKVATESADLQAVDARLKQLSDTLLALRPRLPPRLSTALEMPYRSLANTETGPGERMQLIMTMLNRCAQFNRTITVAEDVIQLEGEPLPRSLETIYWGLGQGYAIDRSTSRAWRGAPAASGWHWEPHPESFGDIAELIAVAQDKRDPHFVAVPAQVTRLAGDTTAEVTP